MENKKIVKDELQMEKGDPLVVFSSETGLGWDTAWAEIESRM